jgi:hypothetical protein
MGTPVTRGALAKHSRLGTLIDRQAGSAPSANRTARIARATMMAWSTMARRTSWRQSLHGILERAAGMSHCAPPAAWQTAVF